MNQEPDGAGQPPPTVNRVDYYNRLLQARDVSPFEAAPAGPPDLSDAAISARLVSTGAELHRIVREELDDRPELHGIVDEMVDRGDTSLRVLRDGDEQRLQDDPGLVSNLEFIVKADGSRPSFLVRNGEAAQSTSPVGAWGPILDSEAALLRNAIACVGRINDPLASIGFWGTGFLVHDDLIVTNRHVLQAIATWQEGSWQLEDGITIDFGYEHRGQASVNPRPLKRVVYAGSREIIPGERDLTKLDLALIELGSGQAADAPTPLAVELAADWPTLQTPIFVVGYPGVSLDGLEDPSLLARLFRSLIGNKRLAPGYVMQSQAQLTPWTVAHDASTIYGNSGSVVLVFGRETVAAGLHFGGEFNPPRENWGHIMGQVLNEPGAGSEKTLRQHFRDYGVKMIDSLA